jgi:hypothetical protein
LRPCNIPADGAPGATKVYKSTVRHVSKKGRDRTENDLTLSVRTFTSLFVPELRERISSISWAVAVMAQQRLEHDDEWYTR